jgi:HSP20 family protein
MYWQPSSTPYSDPKSGYEHEVEMLNRNFHRFIEAIHRIDYGKEAIEAPMVFGFALEPDNQGRPMLQQIGMGADYHAERRPYVKIIEEYADQDKPQKSQARAIIGYHLIFEMPGVKKEDVDIQTRGRLLTVRAKGRTRNYASSIRLPEGINPSSTTAEFENGLLKLQLELLRPQNRKAARVTLE